MIQGILEVYLRSGIKYSSPINRLLIKKTSDDRYDFTLKPKAFYLDMFPSFSHVEITGERGRPVSAENYYNIIVYLVYMIMTIIIIVSSFYISPSQSLLMSFITIAIIAFKAYGYFQLKSITKKLLEGDYLPIA
jgi:hypothetical protein